MGSANHRKELTEPKFYDSVNYVASPTLRQLLFELLLMTGLISVRTTYPELSTAETIGAGVWRASPAGSIESQLAENEIPLRKTTENPLYFAMATTRMTFGAPLNPQG